MASKRQPTASHPAATQAGTLPGDQLQDAAQGMKPEQALALIGLGLMQKMAASGQQIPWMGREPDDGGQADLGALRQRLELTQLAIQTGAPLTTAEATQLLGARPGAAVVERGGLRARRLARNVWKLSRVSEEGGGFGDGFRRRL